MSFEYAAGNAASIAAWFATFETFITAAGWTVVQGTGTTNIIITSAGEDGTLTMLFARLTQAVNNIQIEVRDDLAGTHETTRGNALVCGAGAFDYWMNADEEFINIVIRRPGPAWRSFHFGALYSVALQLTNETQRMVAMNRIGVAAGFNASILQDYLGNWDVDMRSFYNTYSAVRLNPVDGSLSLCGNWVNEDLLIYGQVPGISGRMWTGIANETLITTLDEPPRTTTWIALQDGSGYRFALRTGGELPIGVPDGNFAYETGRAELPIDLMETIIPAFLTGIGWADLGDPGFHSYAHLYYSQGESGADNIYLIVSWNAGANDYSYIFVQDDAGGTHRTGNVYIDTDLSDFPLTYHIAGDLDCFMLVAGGTGSGKSVLWGGKVRPAHPGLDCTYQMLTFGSAFNTLFVLRDCDGNWNQAYNMENDGIRMEPSSPSLIDDRTCLVWPFWARDSPAAGGNLMIGQFQYLYSVDHNNRLTLGDRIPIEDRNYRLFSSGVVNFYAIRTV